MLLKIKNCSGEPGPGCPTGRHRGGRSRCKPTSGEHCGRDGLDRHVKIVLIMFYLISSFPQTPHFRFRTSTWALIREKSIGLGFSSSFHLQRHGKSSQVVRDRQCVSVSGAFLCALTTHGCTSLVALTICHCDFLPMSPPC